jgi:NADH:ubiquinone oxidoreductase subunit
MDIINKLSIKFFCNKVGFDEFGNQYFEAKKTTNSKKRRYIIYNGIAEPSKVPASWHGWIHYTTNDLPGNSYNHLWQKIHLPNLTGTKFSHFYLGNQFKKNIRNKVDPSYQPWQPKN